jgi:hypothetical protein
VEVYKKKMLKKARGSWLLDRLLPRSGRMAWRVTRMSLYRDPIPESVLQLAVDIHKKTHADIRVDHLGTRDFEREWQAWMQTYDPFLVVRADINSPWHHVAVWDEPTFQG